MRYPRPVGDGARIGIWCPSSAGPYEFPNRYRRALQALRDSGYEPVPGRSCSTYYQSPEHAAQAAAEDLTHLLVQERVDAIMVATGGLTSNLVLPYIDWAVVKASRVALIGYSDATALLLAWNQLAELVTFHGPMLLSEWGEHQGPRLFTEDAFQRCISARSDLVLTAPESTTSEYLHWDRDDHRRRHERPADAWRSLQGGVAGGRIVGGNIDTILRLIGTPYMPSLQDSVLFLESDSTRLDLVASQFGQLSQAGIFRGLRALIVGRFRDDNSYQSDPWDALIEAHVRANDYPVLSNVDIGHTEPMLTIPVGGQCTVDADKIMLTVHGGAV